MACEKYMNTRCVWQTKTWLDNVMKDKEADYFYLCSSVAKDDIHYIKLNAGDKYEDCPYKYVEHFRNFDVSSYDWIVYCDDDTYVFHNRLKAELANYDSSKKLLIGEQNHFSKEYDFPLMFGGPGFILSNSLYKEVKSYIESNNDIPIYINGDVTICKWVNKVNEKSEVTIVDMAKKMFNYPIHNYVLEDILPTALSFHYVTEELFELFKPL